MKNILGIETHKYAPELNKVVLKNGAILDAKGTNNIKDFRKLFKKGRVGKYCKISFNHTEEYKRFDKTYQGFINSYKDVKIFIAKLKEKHSFSNDIKISLNYIQG